MEETLSQVKTAVISGRTDIIKAVLENSSKFGSEGEIVKEKILGELVVPEGTFLHLATKLGLLDLMRSLLMAGADVTLENKEGELPLELASNETATQVYVDELLRATAANDIRRMEELIKAGVELNSYDCEEKKNSVLHWAVSFANLATVKFLIDKGADVEAETSEGVTPLHDAVERGDIEIIQELLKAKASPLIKAHKGKFGEESPLDLAAQSGKAEIFSLMSRFLASEFKKRNRQTSSLESLLSSPVNLNLNGGPISPPILFSGFNGLESTIRGFELKAPISPLITDGQLNLLWPQPRSLRQLEGLQFRPQKLFHLSVLPSPTPLHKILDVFGVHKENFLKLGYEVSAQGVEISSKVVPSSPASLIYATVNQSSVLGGPGSYKLHITSNKVNIVGSDIEGLYYAICTFIQLLSLYGPSGGIPPVLIEDSPSLHHRAVLIDVSQERIPNIESLFDVIRTLSHLKINFIHFQMRFDTKSSKPPIYYTNAELLAIDRHCSDLSITLVPAIDISHEISILDFIEEVKPVLSTILLSFPSSKFIHLGPQLSKLIFSSHSVESGDWSLLWELIPFSSPAHSMVFLCSNAGNAHSALLTLPPNVILVQYGFRGDYNFGDGIRELRENGLGTVLCAGTSAWSSLSGCPEAALSNIYQAILAASYNSSLGLIVAHWTGVNSLTPMLFAWPGFLLSAGLAWNKNTHWEYLQNSLASLLSLHVLGDRSGILGQVIIDLGCAETTLLRQSLNQEANDMSNLPSSEGTTLYRLLTHPDSIPLDHLTVDSFIKCLRSVKKCQSALNGSEWKEEHAEYLDEIGLTMEMFLLASRIGRCLVGAGVNPRSNLGLQVVNLGISNLPPTLRTDIANKLLMVIEEYRRVWMIRNLPQGIETSLYQLTSLLQRFIPDSTRHLTGRLIVSPIKSP